MKQTTLLLRIAAAAAMVLILLTLVLFAFQPISQEKVRTGASMPIAERYQSAIAGRMAGIALGNVTIHREYSIPDSELAAPLPNPAKFGEAESPAELQWLLDEAADILDGQSLYFSTETELFPGSTVHYYLDETILAITWKQLINRVVFTFSEVRLAHPSQFRRYLSDGTFGSGKLYKTTEMSKSVNAVVACSADFYAYRRKGVTVVDGIVQKNVGGVADACYIDRDGNMLLERGLKFADAGEAQAYMDEHNVNFSLSFGPILIQDGELKCPRNYALGEVGKPFPRAALCQMDTLHYLFAASNMEVHYYTCLTMSEFAESLLETGCRSAYALDGGQTATVVMNNDLINNVNYGSERLVSDIIYFATAIPEGEWSK